MEGVKLWVACDGWHHNMHAGGTMSGGTMHGKQVVMPPFPRLDGAWGPWDLATSWRLERLVVVEFGSGKESINNRNGVLCGSSIQYNLNTTPV